MTKKQKLELTWIGKDQRPRLEPRILLEDDSQSYHAKHRVTENDIFDNRLIFGDNLLALKALEQEFTGKIKCIFIDPPYNTGSAFEYYDDGVEHSIWLGLMRDRLEILRNLLSEDGTIWIAIDDNEAHYLKVMCDEIFGRKNFINQVSVKMKLTAGASGGGEDKKLKKNIEYLLSYAKNYDFGFSKFNDVFDEENLFDIIDEMEANEQSWKYTSILLEKGEFVEERVVLDGSGDPIKVKKYKGLQRTTVNDLIKRGGTREEIYAERFDWLFSDTNAQTSIRTRIMEEFLSLEKDELLIASYVPKSGRDKNKEVQHYYLSPTIRRVIWLKDTAEKRGKLLFKREKVGTYWQGLALNNLTKEGDVRFPNGKKPEALLRKIMDLATDEGDIVLDSFAGSGTTGAVAHKMRRRWIMIELGEHCHTHVIPRLKKVIDGEDNGGVTEAVGWKGGGGFRYYALAPSLISYDKYDQPIINKEYNPAMLAQAMCKLMGFTYAPSDTVYWQQGKSTETDFIYITTQTLDQPQLAALSEEVGDGRSVLVCCSAFRGKADAYPNITLRKIPRAVLSKCEWGHDDYSLNVQNLPMAEEPQVDIPTPRKLKAKAKAKSTEPSLFGGVDE